MNSLSFEKIAGGHAYQIYIVQLFFFIFSFYIQIECEKERSNATTKKLEEKSQIFLECHQSTSENFVQMNELFDFGLK